LQSEEDIGRRQQRQQKKQKICWDPERRREELERQSRLEMTAEAGALSRYQKPIWTAGLQCVVLPWITPSGGRQAAVRTEDGGGWENDSLMGWVHVLGMKEVSGYGRWKMARGMAGPIQARGWLVGVVGWLVEMLKQS
jgi:hypothetical protein